MRTTARGYRWVLASVGPLRSRATVLKTLFDAVEEDADEVWLAPPALLADPDDLVMIERLFGPDSGAHSDAAMNERA